MSTRAAAAAWGTQGTHQASRKDPDPLDDLGDLTFGNSGSADDHAYTHVSLDDSLKRDPLAARRNHNDDVDEEAFFGLMKAAPPPAPPVAAAAAVAPAAAPVRPTDPLQQSNSMAPFEDESLSDGESLPPAAGQRASGARDASASSSSRAAYSTLQESGRGSEGGGDGAGPSEILAAPTSADLEGLALPDAPVRLWVREPEKVEVTSLLGIKTSYVAYLVRTESNLPNLCADGVEVRRRFSEFEALYKLLKTQYKGYIIPPLPEKSFLEAKIANDDFLRLRRADLQAFLRGVAHHPVLRETDAIHIFLLQAGDLAANQDWHTVQHPPTAASAARGGAGAPSGSALGSSLTSGAPASEAAAEALALSLAASSHAVKAVLSYAPVWANWIKHSVGVGGAPARVLSDEEQTLRTNKELITDLERLLELSCASARSLCGHSHALCGDFYDLSRNMGMLTRYEEAVQAKSGQYTEAGAAAAGRAEDVQRMASATAKQSKLWKTLSLKTAASLVALHDYMIMMPEAVSALEERETALASLWSLEDELLAKQAALLSNGPRAMSREKRVATLNQAITVVEEQIRAAREHYEVVKGRNLSELSRLGLERGSDFRHMMGQFAATQAGLLQASAAVWTALAGQYGARPQTP